MSYKGVSLQFSKNCVIKMTLCNKFFTFFYFIASTTEASSSSGKYIEYFMRYTVRAKEIGYNFSPECLQGGSLQFSINCVNKILGEF